MAKSVTFTPDMIEKYVKLGYWNSKRLSEVWDENAEKYPQKEAIADHRTRLNWLQAKQWIDRIALSLLNLGMKKDDLLAVQLPNCVELVLLRVATEKAGLLCLPMLRTFRHKEVEHILNHTNAVGFVIPKVFRGFDHLQMAEEIKPRLPHLKHIIMVGDEDFPGTIPFRSFVENNIEKSYPPDYLDKTLCPPDEFSLILPTSGTTGFPKLVEHPVYSRMFIG
ncbi:MAG: AMP-binding protein, partial [Dehalococcoidia bacterium]|nr:AMP-binding protein [Dehalococcoidia bacterium]